MSRDDNPLKRVPNVESFIAGGSADFETGRVAEALGTITTETRASEGEGREVDSYIAPSRTTSRKVSNSYRLDPHVVEFMKEVAFALNTSQGDLIQEAILAKQHDWIERAKTKKKFVDPVALGQLS